MPTYEDTQKQRTQAYLAEVERYRTDKDAYYREKGIEPELVTSSPPPAEEADTESTSN